MPLVNASTSAGRIRQRRHRRRCGRAPPPQRASINCFFQIRRQTTHPFPSTQSHYISRHQRANQCGSTVTEAISEQPLLMRTWPSIPYSALLPPEHSSVYQYSTVYLLYVNTTTAFTSAVCSTEKVHSGDQNFDMHLSLYVRIHTKRRIRSQTQLTTYYANT